MGTGKNLDSYIHELREKLWKEDKIRIGGYTYSEWKRERENSK